MKISLKLLHYTYFHYPESRTPLSSGEILALKNSWRRCMCAEKLSREGVRESDGGGSVLASQVSPLPILLSYFRSRFRTEMNQLDIIFWELFVPCDLNKHQVSDSKAPSPWTSITVFARPLYYLCWYFLFFNRFTFLKWIVFRKRTFYHTIKLEIGITC